MKVKFSALNESLPAINAVANIKEFPIKTSYRIGKTLNIISSAIKEVEDFRINTLNKMAKLNEEKTKYIFEPPEQEEVFNKLFYEHKEGECEVPFPFLQMDEIANLNIKIEPAVMAGLDKIGAISNLEVVAPVEGKSIKNLT
jgi:hypothetical protein